MLFYDLMPILPISSCNQQFYRSGRSRLSLLPLAESHTETKPNHPPYFSGGSAEAERDRNNNSPLPIRV